MAKAQKKGHRKTPRPSLRAKVRMVVPRAHVPVLRLVSDGLLQGGEKAAALERALQAAVQPPSPATVQGGKGEPRVMDLLTSEPPWSDEFLEIMAKIERDRKKDMPRPVEL